MAPRLAFIGMGLMGQGITKNLVEKGEFEKPLILYNRTRSRAEEQSARIGHSIVSSSLSEVVSKADIIWSCIQNEEAVTEMFKSLSSFDIRGKLFVESSTIPAETADSLSKQILDAGAEFVSMPVFGEPSLAYAGNLVCVPAGPRESVARIKPYLVGVVAKAIIDLSGESPGKAALLKMIGNVLIVSTMETVAEVSVLAAKTGIGNSHIQELISNYYKVGPPIYAKKMHAGDYYKHEPMVETSKAIDLSSKVLELAASVGVPLKGYEVGIEHMVAARDYAGPKADILSIYGAVRMESNLKFQNSDEK
ncbi:hypothetical protein ACHAPC_002083 [Botrytis cinerea]|uniref:Similar to 6-phosphogluconate dehydrogenase n=1 Tax=Botryotinia fuckeliana (strain T4) TaxID=999810 RepID=G2Y0A1_BOTF4|nr:similar to 6-phosphogluconate dehydrogenase [Botrytis cinerea T4]